jgi:hypothetical protein
MERMITTDNPTTIKHNGFYYPEPIFDDDTLESFIENVDKILKAWLEANSAPALLWELITDRFYLELTYRKGPDCWPKELPRQYDVELSGFVSAISANLAMLIVPPLKA